MNDNDQTKSNRIIKIILQVIIRLLKGIILSILFIFIQSAIISLIEYILGDTMRIHGAYVSVLYSCLFIFNLFYLIIYEWIKAYKKAKWIFTIICCVLYGIGLIEFYRWGVYPPLQIALPIILIMTILIREYIIEYFLNSIYKKVKNKAIPNN